MHNSKGVQSMLRLMAILLTALGCSMASSCVYLLPEYWSVANGVTYTGASDEDAFVEGDRLYLFFEKEISYDRYIRATNPSKQDNESYYLYTFYWRNGGKSIACEFIKKYDSSLGGQRLFFAGNKNVFFEYTWGKGVATLIHKKVPLTTERLNTPDHLPVGSSMTRYNSLITYTMPEEDVAHSYDVATGAYGTVKLKTPSQYYGLCDITKNGIVYGLADTWFTKKSEISIVRTADNTEKIFKLDGVYSGIADFGDDQYLIYKKKNIYRSDCMDYFSLRVKDGTVKPLVMKIPTNRPNLYIDEQNRRIFLIVGYKEQGMSRKPFEMTGYVYDFKTEKLDTFILTGKMP